MHSFCRLCAQSCRRSALYGDLLLESRRRRRSLDLDLDLDLVFGRTGRSPDSRSVRGSARSSRRLCSRLRERCLRLSRSRPPSLRLSCDLERSRCLWRRFRSRERLLERCLLRLSRSSSSLCRLDRSFFSLLLALSSSSPPLAFSSTASLTSASCALSPSGVRLALLRTGTGKPMAASMASSSASFSLRFSSLIRAASASLDSSSPLAYQVKSRFCCQRPTGAMSEWPR